MTPPSSATSTVRAVGTAGDVGDPRQVRVPARRIRVSGTRWYARAVASPAAAYSDARIGRISISSGTRPPYATGSCRGRLDAMRHGPGHRDTGPSSRPTATGRISGALRRCWPREPSLFTDGAVDVRSGTRLHSVPRPRIARRLAPPGGPAAQPAAAARARPPPSEDAALMRFLEDGRPVYTATDLCDYLACGHLVTLKRRVASGEADPARSRRRSARCWRTLGAGHEQQPSRRAQRARPAHQGIRGRSRPLRELRRRAATRSRPRRVEAMRAGYDVIYQPTFFDGRWLGRADFLLRVDTPSARWRVLVRGGGREAGSPGALRGAAAAVRVLGAPRAAAGDRAAVRCT